MGLRHCVGMCYVFCAKVRGCICCMCVVFECMLICCIYVGVWMGIQWNLY